MRLPSRLRFFLVGICALLAVTLGGCAALAPRDPVRIQVVGIEPLAGQGLEARMAVKLRVQNPNETPIDYDGISLELELNDRQFATGVSDQRGSVPRFGETVVSVPVSVSAFDAMRQALRLADGAAAGPIPYVLRGKLAGAAFGSTRFSDQGMLSLPALR